MVKKDEINVSIDYLLDSGENIDLSVMREEINLDDYTYVRKITGRWSKKAGSSRKRLQIRNS